MAETATNIAMQSAKRYRNEMRFRTQVQMVVSRVMQEHGEIHLGQLDRRRAPADRTPPEPDYGDDY